MNFINQGFYGHKLKEYFHIEYFFIEPLKISCTTIIFFMYNGKELCCTFLSWNACDEVRCKFEVKIMKVKNKVKL